MTERLKIGYQRLFEIRLLHHYWLDDGEKVFYQIDPTEQPSKRLLAYDRRSFFGIAPTAATSQTLQGLGCIYKNTALGCIVAVKDKAVIPAQELFEFVVTLEDPSAVNYTALTLLPQQVYEFYQRDEKKTYRYKENVAVLSNLTGVGRKIDDKRVLFLSREYPPLGEKDKVESLVVVGTALKQLTSDQPDAYLKELDTLATNLPVFVHQGDIPAIVAPAEFVEAPAGGILLSKNIPDNIFALIQLASQRPDDEDFSLIDSHGQAKTVYPVFQVHFKNRATIWRYFDKNTGTPKDGETDPLPLTYFDNAGKKQKPSGGPIKAEKSAGKITQLVSEIFI